MIANDMKLPGLDGAGLNAHALFPKVQRKPFNHARAMPVVALIDDRQPHWQWFWGRCNLPLTLAGLEVVSILHRANELHSVKAAEAVLIGKQVPAIWTFFH